MNAAGPASLRLYSKFFLHDGADVVGPLIDAIVARKERVLREWHTLYSSRFGAHRAISERLFQETYGPNLRTAIMCIVRGDAAGFVSFAARLGKQLADEGVPFPALASHLNLWKESCAKALADDPGRLCPALIVLDKLSCCFLSAAADGYYGCVGGERHHDGRATKEVQRNAAVPACSSGALHGLVGRSACMQQVFERIRQIARGNGPVLIVGETGTGKELAARAVHEYGPRHAAAFVAVNCAALPRDLIESELFGYARGAFSGAVGEHLGLFRAASGGTLFLDEITEMGSELQAKLLRVLQERAVRPVGSITEVPVDVRIIASTNRDPQTVRAAGLLRADLYYRLCGSMVQLPPLRDRVEDIPLLAEHYLTILNDRYARSGQAWCGVTPEAMEALCARSWYGNVRELFNVLESAFTSTASHIRLADVSAHLVGTESPVAPGNEQRVETYQESERDLIQRALASTRGNKLLAARRLGISRKKLYSKIAKYALPVLVLGQLAGVPVPASVRHRPARMASAHASRVRLRSPNGLIH